MFFDHVEIIGSPEFVGRVFRFTSGSNSGRGISPFLAGLGGEDDRLSST
jgi:hypothetical protein